MARIAPPPWRVFRAPKRGNTDAEYEDAWAADARAGRYAVADGASESSFAELWARLLAESFVAARRPWDNLDWLSDPRQRWSAEIDALDLPWYAEMKREQGAFATLLGLAVKPASAAEPGRWRALAVGDSCLIRIHNHKRRLSFPVSAAADFGNQPNLLGSRPGRDCPPVFAQGFYRPGDYLFLMTDALAQWFLQRCEENRRPWNHFKRLLAKPEPDFTAWVEARRDKDNLRNDDVTLLAVGPMPAIPTPEEE